MIFISNVLTKYTLEMILTYFGIQILRSFFQSKFFCLLVFLTNYLKLKNVLNYILSKILNHTIFSTLEKYSTLTYSYYCNNKVYREYINKICFKDSQLISIHLNYIINIVLSKKILYSKERFLQEIKNNLTSYRNDKTSYIITLDKANIHYEIFARKFLYQLEIINKNNDLRVKELKKKQNNLEIVIEYFYILHDSLVLEMSEIPTFTNYVVNGELKKKLKVKG